MVVSWRRSRCMRRLVLQASYHSRRLCCWHVWHVVLKQLASCRHPGSLSCWIGRNAGPCCGGFVALIRFLGPSLRRTLCPVRSCRPPRCALTSWIQTTVGTTSSPCPPSRHWRRGGRSPHHPALVWCWIHWRSCAADCAAAGSAQRCSWRCPTSRTTASTTISWTCGATFCRSIRRSARSPREDGTRSQHVEAPQPQPPPRLHGATTQLPCPP
mmetsp:Transcript_24915/g.70945  ORF Transcript_24915/g.70945 Transcript_24915/m.70945 type:complete len:213 (+) Transcript_24915:803-1441(+)